MRAQIREYAAWIRGIVQGAWEEEHTPHETAASFAFGAFILALPLFVFGLVILLLLVSVSDRADKIAVFAPVPVFNPLVKAPLYGLGYGVGEHVLGLLYAVDLSGVNAVVLSTVQFAVGIAVVSIGIAALSYAAARILLRWTDSNILGQ